MNRAEQSTADEYARLILPRSDEVGVVVLGAAIDTVDNLYTSWSNLQKLELPELQIRDDGDLLLDHSQTQTTLEAFTWLRDEGYKLTAPSNTEVERLLLLPPSRLFWKRMALATNMDRRFTLSHMQARRADTILNAIETAHSTSSIMLRNLVELQLNVNSEEY
jgi:hypothetical protein